MEEPQDQPSAIYSTGQPMSDNTSGSLLSLNTSQVCQRCSSAFVLSSSLELHMATFHGETLLPELPVASGLQDSTPSGQERCSTEMAEDSRENPVTSSNDFVIKLEPSWSMKEEPQDQPSAVCSPGQPMSDNTSGSLLSLNTSHVCQRCSAAFVLSSSLELHMATFHGETLQDVENVGNYNKAAVRGRKVDDVSTGRAEEEKKIRKHVCDVCSKAFTRAGRLKTHRLIHTGHKPFVCDVCSKAFTEAGHLKRHKLIHTAHKPFACDMCSKAFRQAADLKEHRLIHIGHKPYVCDVCLRPFSRAGNLNIHKLIHTGHRPFACDVCSKAFTTAGNLKIHKFIHIGHKPYVCDVCNKAYTQANSLKTHKSVVHTGHKPFVCDVCGEALTQACHLKRHMTIHLTGQKSFVCDVCDKAFSQSGTLKEHKLTHTDHKPWACDVCSKTFTRSGYLKQHKMNHTGHKSFQCDECSKAFFHSSSLSKHKKKIHTEQRTKGV